MAPVLSENDQAVVARLEIMKKNAFAEIERRGGGLLKLENYRYLMDEVTKFQFSDRVPKAQVAQWIPNLTLRAGLTAAVAVPEGKGPFPVLLHTHGHGLVAGHAVDYEFWMRIMASHGFVVVFPDYSLQPEATYDQQIEEMQFAAEWLVDNAGAISGDGSRIIISGDSAGGGLSFDLLLRNLSDPKGVPFKAYASVDGNVDGILNLMPGEQKSLLDRVDSETQLPPIVMVVGSKDPAFANQARAANHFVSLKKDFEWHVYHGMEHDFAKFPDFEIMHVANERMMKFLLMAVS